MEQLKSKQRTKGLDPSSRKTMHHNKFGNIFQHIIMYPVVATKARSDSHLLARFDTITNDAESMNETVTPTKGEKERTSPAPLNRITTFELHQNLSSPFRVNIAPINLQQEEHPSPIVHSLPHHPNELHQPTKLEGQQNTKKRQRARTLTIIFPPPYSLSSSGSSAGSRENSDPSMSVQSSPCPSRVMVPGLKRASIRTSDSGSQLHSPDSWCELTRAIGATERWRRRRAAAAAAREIRGIVSRAKGSRDLGSLSRTAMHSWIASNLYDEMQRDKVDCDSCSFCVFVAEMDERERHEHVLVRLNI